MIKNVLLAFLACLVLAFIGIWIWTGGIGRAWDEARKIRSIGDFFMGSTSTLTTFRLPWQPEFPTFDDSNFQTETESGSSQRNQPVANAYESPSSNETDVKNFGTSSSMRGTVRFSNTFGARENEPRAEFLQIAANSQNTSPVSITGWSLQSAVTGVRIPIPGGASVFKMGYINDYGTIRLEPGMSAVITTALSPVGTSFRENICSGYLGQLQYYSPPISASCPSGSSVLPFTSENLRAYGEKCFDFIEYVPACSTPLDSIPNDISPNCRAFAINNLSYNGCVQTNRWRTDFLGDSWRVFLGSQAELWGNSHDIIRLLDAEGRTVDVASY